jgi:hypothetical protein
MGILAVFGGAAWLAFWAFSMKVSMEQGYFGFLDVARREPWGAQILTDLFFANVMVNVAILVDARRRKALAWPWLLASWVLGSLATAPYFLLRLWRAGSSEPGRSGEDQRR